MNTLILFKTAIVLKQMEYKSTFSKQICLNTL